MKTFQRDFVKWALSTAVLLAILWCGVLVFEQQCYAADTKTEHFKMISSIEYKGKEQYRNYAETLATVQKQISGDNIAQFNISMKDITEGKARSIGADISFTIDRNTKKISNVPPDMQLMEKVNNRCVENLSQLVKENVGNTWKQAFDLSGLSTAIPNEIRFTVHASAFESANYGQLIGVRALSEPFEITAIPNTDNTGNKAEAGTAKFIVNTFYLFDPSIEDTFVSVTVCEGTTKINGYKETLRYEAATYKTDAAGNSADLSGLDKSFEKFVKKVGMTKKGLKAKEESLPADWVKNEGLRTNQAASVCAALACEGAPNPVAMTFMTMGQSMGMQSLGGLGALGGTGSVSAMLSSGATGLSGMSLGSTTIMGMSPAAAGGAIGGGAGGAAAAGGGIGGGGGGGGGSASP
jgi:hypothetical protein